MLEIVPGIYQHKRLGIYEVVAIGRDANNYSQQLVIYKSLTDSKFLAGTIWVRTIEEFSTPGRFTRILNSSINDK